MLGRVSEDSWMDLNYFSILQRYPSACGMQCEQNREEKKLESHEAFKMNKAEQSLAGLSL